MVAGRSIGARATESNGLDRRLHGETLPKQGKQNSQKLLPGTAS